MTKKLGGFHVGSFKRPETAIMKIVDPATEEDTGATLTVKSPYTKAYRKHSHKVDQLRAVMVKGAKIDDEGNIDNSSMLEIVGDMDFESIESVEKAQVELAVAVVEDWSNFYDDQDKPLPFSEDALRSILNDVDWLASAIQMFCSDTKNFTKKATSKA